MVVAKRRYLLSINGGDDVERGVSGGGVSGLKKVTRNGRERVSKRWIEIVAFAEHNDRRRGEQAPPPSPVPP